MTISLIVLGLLLLAVVAQAILGVTYTARYRRYVESLRAGGEPYWIDELQAARAVIPDEQNSAKVIAPIADELRNLNNSVPAHVLKFGAIPPKVDPFHGTPRYTIAPTRKFLEKNRHLLDALRQIRDMKRGRFDVQLDPKDMFAPFLVSMAPVRHAVKLTYNAISIDILDDNFEAAWNRLPMLFSLCGAHHDEPFLLSRLIQNASDLFAVRAVQLLLCSRELDDSHLVAIDEWLSGRLAKPDLSGAFRGERIIMDEFCSSIGRGIMPISPPAKATLISPLWKYAPPSLVRRNQLEYAQMMTHLAGKANDARALLQAADAIDSSVDGMWTKSVVLADTVPSVYRSVILDLRVRMLLETARCAMAAERYRLKNGSFPESLDDLVPEFLPSVPDDAFGATSLLSLLEDGAITIYSIDEDGVDDGGDVVVDWNSVDSAEQPADIGFRLLPPEKRGVVILDVPPPEDEE